MEGTAAIMSALDRYHDDCHIHPLRFGCRHLAECRGNCEGFSEARMPSLGAAYGEPGLPRVVVVSLDPGYAPLEPSERVLRLMEPSEHIGPANKHWYLTHELLLHLLTAIKPSVKLRDVPALFAHTNSARCCMNRARHRQAAPRLFANCRGYMRGEVAVLDPDIILSQGEYARIAVSGCIQGAQQGCGLQGHACRHALGTGPTGKRVLWLHTYHPTQPRGLYWRSLVGYRECYAKLVKEFHGYP